MGISANMSNLEFWSQSEVLNKMVGRNMNDLTSVHLILAMQGYWTAVVSAKAIITA